MANNVGFFEKRKLDKLAQSLPDHAPDTEVQTYINVANNYGTASLIRLACVLESLPKEWKDKSGKKYTEHYRYFKLRKLCLIGLPHTVKQSDEQVLLANIDNMDIDLAVEVLSQIGGDTIQKNIRESLKADNLRRRLLALYVLQKTGDSSSCSQIAELVSEPKLRAAAIRTLASLKCNNNLDSIIIGLTDSDSHVVQTSLAALAQMPTEYVVDTLVAFAEPYVARYERLMNNQMFDLNELNRIRDVISGLAAHKHPQILLLMERIGDAMIPNIRGNTYSVMRIDEINKIVWMYTGDEKYRTQLTR